MGTKKLNAVAGVGARNGADQDGSRKKASCEDRAATGVPASHLVALIDRDGCVAGIFDGRAAVRSFLQGGWA